MRLHKLSHQILIVFVTVVTLSLIVSGVLITSLSLNIVVDNVNSGYLLLVRRIAEEIELEMANMRPIISLLADSPALETMDSEEVFDELINYQERFPVFQNMYVADLSGEQIASTYLETPKNVTVRLGFQAAMRGEIVFSDVYIDDTQAPVLTAYAPVWSGTKIIGILVADVSFARVQSVLAELQLTRNETAVVFAENGRIVAHSRLNELDNIPTLNEGDIVDKLVHETSGIVEDYTDELGRRVTGVHAPVPELKWGIVIQTPRNELISEVRTLYQSSTIAVIGGIVLAAIAGWVMANQLAKPINQLALTTQKIAKGDLSARSALAHTSGEMGQLASAFDSMAKSLETRQVQAESAEYTLQVYAHRLEALQEIDRAILAAWSTEDIVAAASQHIQALIPATHVSVTDFNNEQSDNKSSSLNRMGAIVNHREMNLPLLVGIADTDEQKQLHTIADTREMRQISSIDSALIEQGLQSYIVYPLIAQENLIGILNIGTEQAQAFTSEHVDIISEIADPLALAIRHVNMTERIQNYASELEQKVENATQEIRQHASQLESLYGVNRVLLTTLDLESLLSKVTQQIKDAFRADRCTIFLFNEKSGKLHTQTASGYAAERLLNFTCQPGEEVIGQVYKNNQVQYIPDLKKKPDLPLRDDVRTLFAVPIHRRTKDPIGVLSIASLQVDAFTPEQQRLLRSMSDQIAQAIENVNLYHATERYAENLSVLYEVGKDIVANRDLDMMLEIITQAAVMLVGGNRSLIVLVDSDQERLKNVTGYDCDYKLNYEYFHRSLNGWVFKTKVPSLSYNIQMDKRAKGIGQVGTSDFRNGPAIIAPLIVGEETIGTLTVLNDQGNERFTNADLSLITMLSGLAAIAIQNVQLYHASLEADRIKSAFLASMSHELRTPLNSIIGFTGIMLQGIVSPLTPELEKQLRMVYDAAKHLLALINDVLDISKIEAGELRVNADVFDMADVVAKVARTLTPLAEKKNLALEVEISQQVGKLKSDPRRVEQILINLANNAIKFTNTGKVSIKCEVEDDMIVTSVNDTGMGIKAEDVTKLFNPFQQIDTGTDRVHEGTGLGLSICRKLLDLLGGKIWVESEWEVGSTFTFTLPINQGGHDETNGTGH